MIRMFAVRELLPSTSETSYEILIILSEQDLYNDAIYHLTPEHISSDYMKNKYYNIFSYNMFWIFLFVLI